MGTRLQVLTTRQQKFVDEVLVGKTGHEAARVAGYSMKNTAVAVRLMARPYIAAAIGEGRERIRRKHAISSERLIEELSLIAFGNPKELFDETTGALKDVHLLSAEVAKMLDIEATMGKNGHNVKVRAGASLKLAALKELRELAGLGRADSPPVPIQNNIQANVHVHIAGD